MEPNNISIIKRVPTPQKKRDVRSFLGLAGYYRRFIKDFSNADSPLFGLLAKDSEFCWTNSCQDALEILKEKLTTAPILRGPNWALPFHIHVDASNKFLGEALGQIYDKLPYVIYFISKKFSKAEFNYTIIEKELLAIIHSLNKFRHYITRYQNFLHTNHATIKYLMNKPDVNARIIRWFLLLERFDLTIIDKPRKENVVAYFLSRLDLPAGDEGMVDDQLLDGHLFAILVLSPWFSHISNYLVAAIFPPNLSSRKKTRIVR